MVNTFDNRDDKRNNNGFNKQDNQKMSPFKKIFYRVKAFFAVPANVILVVTVVVLLGLTVYPLFLLVLNTFIVHSSDKSALASYGTFSKGDYTVFSWVKLLTQTDYNYARNNFFIPFFNSVKTAVLSATIAIIIGGLVAFLVTRTNLKFKRFISIVFIFPYVMPTWTLAQFWLNLFKNNQLPGAMSNGFMASVFNIYMPENFVFGLFPMVIVYGIHYAPFAYLFVGSILKNMDANLEESAVILKAKRFKIIRKITFPIVKPAILSTFLLVFASVMGSYTAAVYLGTPVGFYVLSTKIKAMVSVGQAQSYIMGCFLIAVGIMVMTVNNLITGKRKSYTTVTGKSSQISFIDLKKLKNVISICLVVFVFSITILPLFSFALESVINVPGTYQLSNLTLDYWIAKPGAILDNSGLDAGLFYEETIWKAMWNSLRLSLTVAFLAGTGGMLIGYGVARRRGTKLATFVSNLAFFPYLVPAMALGAVYLAVAVKFSFLHNTMLILVIVGFIKYLPFATRAGTNSMLQLSAEIEEAAIIVNVPWWKRMLRIIFPIQKSSFISGYLLPFTSCMRELSLFALLIGTGTQTLTYLLMYFSQKNSSQYSNALTLLIIVIVLVIQFVVKKTTGASIDKGVGGS